MKIDKDNGQSTNLWTLYNWGDVNGFTAESGTTLAGNAIEITADETGAQFTARAQWVTCNDKNAPHAVRVVRVSDGAVIAASTQATGKEGVVTATATADVLTGELYKLQTYCESAQPGNYVPPKSGGFLGIGNTPGTFLQIV